MARHILLQLDRQDEPIIMAEIPETYKVPLTCSSSNYRGPYLNINTNLANTTNPSPVFTSFMPMTPVYTQSLSRPSSPWQMPPPPPSTPVSGLGRVPPNHPYLQDYAMLLLNNIRRLYQQQEEQNTGGSLPVTNNGHQYSAKSVSPPCYIVGSVGGHGSSGIGSSLHSSPLRYFFPSRIWVYCLSFKAKGKVATEQ